MQSEIWLPLIALQSTEKILKTPFNPVFFILLIVKVFEMLHKHNGYGFISEFFALNIYISTALTNKKQLLLLYSRLNTIFLADCVKSIGHLASAVIIVSSNLFFGAWNFGAYQHAQKNYYQLQK